MSKIAYCPSGGMDGIIVSNYELKKFADSINRKIIDCVIPLPNLTVEQQKAMLVVCISHDVDTESEYWETEDFGHGWCCKKCGTVTQWG